MRDSGSVAAQRRGDRIDKLVKRVLAVAGNIGQKFQPPHAAPVNRGIRPAECPFQAARSLQSPLRSAPRPADKPGRNARGIAFVSVRSAASRTAWEGRPDRRRFAASRFDAEGLGLVLREWKAQAAEIETPGGGLKIDTRKALDRRCVVRPPMRKPRFGVPLAQMMSRNVRRSSSASSRRCAFKSSSVSTRPC